VNLLLLAKDATENGFGHLIRISSRRETPDRSVIEVSDDGRLIPSDQLSSIFEPNFVGPKSGRGTGIEFSICREIVRQHGGQITAEVTTQPGYDSLPDTDTVPIKGSLPGKDRLPGKDNLPGKETLPPHLTTFRVSLPGTLEIPAASNPPGTNDVPGAKDIQGAINAPDEI